MCGDVSPHLPACTHRPVKIQVPTFGRIFIVSIILLLFHWWLSWHGAYCSMEQVIAAKDNRTGWNMSFLVVMSVHQSFINTICVQTTTTWTSNKQLQWIYFGWINLVFLKESSLEIKFIFIHSLCLYFKPLQWEHKIMGQWANYTKNVYVTIYSISWKRTIWSMHRWHP